jgi:hypothetical protein
MPMQKMAQKKKQEIFTEDYNTVSNSNKNPTVRMVRMGTNAEEAGRWAIRMGYGSAKEMDDDFQVVLRGDKKDTKARVTNQKGN